jgi:hypothetical protein
MNVAVFGIVVVEEVFDFVDALSEAVLRSSEVSLSKVS